MGKKYSVRESQGLANRRADTPRNSEQCLLDTSGVSTQGGFHLEWVAKDSYLRDVPYDYREYLPPTFACFRAEIQSS